MTKFLWVVLALAIVVAVLIGNQVNKYQLRKRIRAEWGHVPRGSLRHDHEKSLKNTWEQLAQQQQTDSQIDDNTWHDLDMFAVFELLNATGSSIGSEALYARLRGYNFSDQEQAQLDELVTFFAEHPAKREEIQFELISLGKRDFNSIFAYLQDPEAYRLPSSWLYRLLACGPFAALLIGFFNPKIMLIALIAALAVNILVYFTKKEAVEKELLSMNYLVHMLLLSKRLSRREHPLRHDFQQLYKPLKAIERVAFSFQLRTGSDQEMLLDYLNMMFMLPFLAYDFVLHQLKHNNEQAQQLWWLIGRLEIAFAVLNFEQFMPVTCRPAFHTERLVKGKETYHPLLSEPVANDVNWQRHTLVTGSNASGKSTYVKSVAINCILAQTIGVACAESFALPRSHVLTSMALEDNLFAGESYFIAEIKSIKRIIRRVKTGATCLCFIDEILRGTNTIERIAASTAVVSWLEQYPTLSFIATHDIELTEILKHHCNNVHFQEEVSIQEGILFSYLLKEGPATEHNAIRLLAALDYPSEIVAQAKQQAAAFEADHSWPVIP